MIIDLQGFKNLGGLINSYEKNINYNLSGLQISKSRTDAGNVLSVFLRMCIVQHRFET